MLREVKYLEARQTEAIPETAVQIYTTRGQLWQYVASLELTVGGYNKVSFHLASKLDCYDLQGEGHMIGVVRLTLMLAS